MFKGIGCSDNGLFLGDNSGVFSPWYSALFIFYLSRLTKDSIEIWAKTSKIRRVGI